MPGSSVLWDWALWQGRRKCNFWAHAATRRGYEGPGLCSGSGTRDFGDPGGFRKACLEKCSQDCSTCCLVVIWAVSVFSG